MPLNDADWRQIYSAIGDAIPPSSIVQGVVIRSDELNNLIWLNEFGDQPIPLFMFDYQVTYFDTQPLVANLTTGAVSSKVVKKQTRILIADVKPLCPKVGDTVLVLKQHGSRRLPKCIGVLHSTNYLVPGDSGE